MDHIFEIFKLTIPALVVFATTYFLVTRFLDKQNKETLAAVKMENGKTTIPLRIQSYERLVLFLERISPESLMIRTYRRDISANDLKIKLKKNISDEFDHNVAQQLYISNNAWASVSNAKNEMLTLINLTSERMNEKSTAEEFSKTFFQISAGVQIQSTNKSILLLKEEVRRMF